MMRKVFLVIFLLSTVTFCGEKRFSWAQDTDACGPQGGCDQKPQVSVTQENAQFVPEITYDEFITLRKGNKNYILLDARPANVFINGHIEGALSFPLSDMNEEKIKELIPQGVKVVVYCQSASCQTSRLAAQLLRSFNYDAIDYHGGVMEWTQKGNALVKE